MNADSPSARGLLGWLRQTLEIAAGLLVLGVVFCVTANVFGRFVLNYSYTWAEELSRVLFIWLVLLGAGVGSLGNEHVAVTFFRDKAPAGLRKAAPEQLAALTAARLAKEGEELVGAWDRWGGGLAACDAVLISPR